MNRYAWTSTWTRSARQPRPSSHWRFHGCARKGGAAIDHRSHEMTTEPPTRRTGRTILMPEKATPLLLVYGGTSLDGLLYRATADCPPTLDDFRSHESLGLPYPQALFIRATGISVYRTRRQLERSRVRFDLGPATAAVELRTAGVAWAEPEAWRQGSRRPARQASAWRATPPTRARQYARRQAEAWRRALRALPGVGAWRPGARRRCDLNRFRRRVG